MSLSRIERFPLRCVLMTVVFVRAAICGPITLLAPPAGYTTGEGIAINASGQVAATLYTGTFGNFNFATALYSNGSWTDVAAGNGKGSGSSFDNGLNDSGSQVGTYYTGTAETQAFVLSSSGTETTLKNLNTAQLSQGSEAYAINDSGLIVGSSYTANNASFAPVEWNATGKTVTNLGTIAGGSDGTAYAINANGEIVGTAGGTIDPTTGLLDGYAFSYSGGKITAISGLTGFSDAWALNNSGEIVGDETVGGNLVAYIDVGGTVTSLGTLGGETSAAYGVNSSGEVVGYADTATGSDAFLYENGAMIDLNTLLPVNSGWVLQTANGINDSGQITGLGLYDGSEQAFVLDTQTTPEPGTMALSCLGLAIAAGWYRSSSRPAAHRT